MYVTEVRGGMPCGAMMSSRVLLFGFTPRTGYQLSLCSPVQILCDREDSLGQSPLGLWVKLSLRENLADSVRIKDVGV